jgi:hypothetical protein
LEKRLQTPPSLRDGVETAGSPLAQERLELREGHLDWTEIGRIGRQEEKPCAFRDDIAGRRRRRELRSIQFSKMRRFIGALMMKGATMPCDLRPAMKVCVFLSRLMACGIPRWRKNVAIDLLEVGCPENQVRTICNMSAQMVQHYG